jgi:hypothetical protein
MQVGEGKIALCLTVAEVRCAPEPVDRNGITLRNTHAPGIALAQRELRLAVGLDQ